MTKKSFLYFFISLFTSLTLSFAAGNNISLSTGMYFGDATAKIDQIDAKIKSSNPFVLGFSYARDLNTEFQVGVSLNSVSYGDFEDEDGEDTKIKLGNSYDLSLFTNYTFYKMDKLSTFATAGLGYSFGRKIKLGYQEEEEEEEKTKDVNFNSVVYNIGVGAKYDIASQFDVSFTLGYTGYTEASGSAGNGEDKYTVKLNAGYVSTKLAIGYKF